MHHDGAHTGDLRRVGPSRARRASHTGAQCLVDLGLQRLHLRQLDAQARSGQPELVLAGPHEQRVQAQGHVVHGVRRRVPLRGPGRHDPRRLGRPQEVQQRQEVGRVLRRGRSGEDVASDGEVAEVQAGRAPLAGAPALHAVRLVEDDVRRRLAHPVGDRLIAGDQALVVDEQHLAACAAAAARAGARRARAPCSARLPPSTSQTPTAERRRAAVARCRACARARRAHRPPWSCRRRAPRSWRRARASAAARGRAAGTLAAPGETGCPRARAPLRATRRRRCPRRRRRWPARARPLGARNPGAAGWPAGPDRSRPRSRGS